MKTFIDKSAKYFIIAFLLLLALAVCCGCKTIHDVQYVDREVVKESHDTLTLEVHDSVYNEVIQKGDTVRITKYKERIKYKDRVVVKTDTLTVIDVQKETIEKRYIPKWCYWCLGACCVALLFAIFKVARWLRLI